MTMTPLLAAPTALILCTALTTGAAGREHPAKPTHRVQVGKASFYGPHHAGKITASGAKMAPSSMIAASKTLPLGSRAKVTNLDTGKSVAVTVVDRGPYAKDRIIDVSSKAADKLDMKDDGVAPVKVQALGPPKAGR
jgi:rare lipoprotein A